MANQKPRPAVTGDPYIEQLTEADYWQLYYYMRLARDFENRIIKLYRQGKIVGGVYTGTGNEATSVGTAFALDRDDILLPMHRDIGAHFAHGQTAQRLMCQYLGRANGPTRGRDGNMHNGDHALGIFSMISHLGTMIPVAAGAALGGRLLGKKTVALNYIGDGGSSIGDFHEGLNFAAVLKLPMILVIENNQFAYSTPVHQQYACKDLADRAKGYGMPGVIVDGNDILEVYAVTREAVERGRAGKGPTLIESKSMRMRGHSEHDDHFYVPKQLLADWKSKDPIGRFEEVLKKKGFATGNKLEEAQDRVLAEIDEAVRFAEQSPFPAPEEAAEGVYAD
jgi:pyruvate dehydrogenase E1 component alpha subunit